MFRELIVFCLINYYAFLVYADSDRVQCLDDDGKPVDWFVIYKLPRLKYSNLGNSGGNVYSLNATLKSSRNFRNLKSFEDDDDAAYEDYDEDTVYEDYDEDTVYDDDLDGVGGDDDEEDDSEDEVNDDDEDDDMFNGERYAYMTSNTGDGWQYSDNSITDDDSMVARTLNQWYYFDDINSVFYNGQPPSKRASSSYAHAKGVIISDDDTGLWMIHTVPHFPDTDNFVSSFLLHSLMIFIFCVPLVHLSINRNSIRSSGTLHFASRKGDYQSYPKQFVGVESVCLLHDDFHCKEQAPQESFT